MKDIKSKPKVFMLYTGGTIGMAGSPLAPLSAVAFAKLVASQPGFTRSTLTTELDEGKPIKIDYVLKSLDKPLDSSSMTPEDWVTIAETLLNNYEGYNGLVVLHGTDTMAYSASALSFLMEGLDKPIIFSGSQVPLQQTRNDALRNMTTAIVLAATENVPESTLFFDTKLIRGNRSEKVNASFFPAFESPNFGALGNIGIDIEIDQKSVLKPPSPKVSLSVKKNRTALLKALTYWKKAYSEFSIITLILFPGIQASMVQAMLDQTTPTVKGVIIMAFGSGNAPADKELTKTLKTAHKKGVVLVDQTQVLKGFVDLDAYQSASGLKKAGAISGYDMTPEASLSKIIWLTGKGLPQKEIESQMEKSLRGELSK